MLSKKLAHAFPLKGDRAKAKQIISSAVVLLFLVFAVAAVLVFPIPARAQTVYGPSTPTISSVTAPPLGSVQSCFQNARDWAFWVSVADGGLYYNSSTDATAWTPATLITPAFGSVSGPFFGVSVDCVSNNVYLVYWILGYNFTYAKGSLGSGGAISFSTLNENVTAGVLVGFAQITLDSLSTPWVLVGNPSNFEAWELSSTTWVNQQPITAGQPIALAPFVGAGGHMGLVYVSGSGSDFSVLTYDGVGFGIPVTVADGANECSASVCSVTSIQSTLYLASGEYGSPNSILLRNFTYGAGSWGTPTTVAIPDVSAAVTDEAIASGGPGPSTTLVVIYDNQEVPGMINYTISVDSGSTWSATALFEPETHPMLLSSIQFLTGGTTLGVTWYPTLGHVLMYARLDIIGPPPTTTTTTPTSTTTTTTTAPTSTTSTTTTGSPTTTTTTSGSIHFPVGGCGVSGYPACTTTSGVVPISTVPTSSPGIGEISMIALLVVAVTLLVVVLALGRRRLPK